MTYTIQTWEEGVSGPTRGVSAARLAHIETGVGNALDKTETGTQTVSGGVTLAANKKLTLTDSQSTGNINRLLTMVSTNDVDRPSISWIDETGLHVGCFHYHTRLNDALGGTVLKQFEIKTIASQSGPDPSDERTRFTVGTQSQRVKVGFVYTDTVEIYQGENPVTVGESVTSFGIDFRAVAQDTFNGSNFKASNISCQIDASDNVGLFIDVNPPYTTGGSLYPGSKTATLTLFRSTSITASAGPQLKIKKGDNTNTDSLVYSAKTGLLELPLALSTTTGVKLGADANATLYRSATSTIASAGKITASLGLGCGNSASASAVGSLSKKMEVFDTAGASLGFVPIYTTIT